MGKGKQKEKKGAPAHLTARISYLQQVSSYLASQKVDNPRAALEDWVLSVTEESRDSEKSKDSEEPEESKESEDSEDSESVESSEEPEEPEESEDSKESGEAVEEVKPKHVAQSEPLEDVKEAGEVENLTGPDASLPVVDANGIDLLSVVRDNLRSRGIRLFDPPPCGGLPSFLSSHLHQIAQKSRIRLGPEVKRSFCSFCRNPLVGDGNYQKYIENLSRKKKKPHADVLILSCVTCGTKKRIPIGAKRQLKKSQRRNLKKDSGAVAESLPAG